METVLSKAGLKVGDTVEIVDGSCAGETVTITGYKQGHLCYVTDHPDLSPVSMEISRLRRIDPSDPQPEDEVNSPSHYTHGGIECIDSIQASMSKEEFEGYCKGNAQKYLWRWRHKGGRQSLEKAAWYLNKLLEVVE